MSHDDGCRKCRAEIERLRAALSKMTDHHKFEYERAEQAEREAEDAEKRADSYKARLNRVLDGYERGYADRHARRAVLAVLREIEYAACEYPDMETLRSDVNDRIAALERVVGGE